MFNRKKVDELEFRAEMAEMQLKYSQEKYKLAIDALHRAITLDPELEDRVKAQLDPSEKLAALLERLLLDWVVDQENEEFDGEILDSLERMELVPAFLEELEKRYKLKRQEKASE